ncbi:hypothetical protein HMPREF3204_00467 [Gardnerella pickettii]|nr:hypothetical protein HMPREF3204_00467 [Gardnerella pickettii]
MGTNAGKNRRFLLLDTPMGGGLEFINISGIVVTRASGWR